MINAVGNKIQNSNESLIKTAREIELSPSKDKVSVEALQRFKDLLEDGANARVIVNGSTPLLSVSRYYPEFFQDSEKYDQGLTKTVDEFKMLIHRFGTSPDFCYEGNDVQFKGFWSENVIPKLVESLKEYQAHLKETPLSISIDWDSLIETVHNSLNTLSVLEHIEKENPLNKVHAFASGWIGHAANLIIANYGGSNWLYKLNRGNASYDQPGILIDKMPWFSGEVASNQLYQLLIKDRGTKIAKEKFVTYLNTGFGIMKRDKQTIHIPHTSQKIGNCTWASAKLFVRALIYIQLMQNRCGFIAAEQESKGIYKDFTTFDRLSAAKKFKENFRNGKYSTEEDQNLAKQVKEALEVKCYDHPRFHEIYKVLQSEATLDANQVSNQAEPVLDTSFDWTVSKSSKPLIVFIHSTTP